MGGDKCAKGSRFWPASSGQMALMMASFLPGPSPACRQVPAKGLHRPLRLSAHAQEWLVHRSLTRDAHSRGQRLRSAVEEESTTGSADVLQGDNTSLFEGAQLPQLYAPHTWLIRPTRFHRLATVPVLCPVMGAISARSPGTGTSSLP
jgi:hypothetical protein